MIIRSFVGLLLSISLFQFSSAKIILPSIFSDGMVLQQQSEVSIWGKARRNYLIKVKNSWSKEVDSTLSDDSGYWEIKITTPSAGGPFSIIISDDEKLILNDVLIGEVWFCSGQSNMEKPMLGGVNQPIKNSNIILLNSKDSGLRLFNIKRRASLDPLSDCSGSWRESNPESASTFSAVGFQFGQQLRRALDVPVGIIEAAWGGTPIKTWMRAEDVRMIPQIDVEVKKPSPKSPACLFNGMVNPIAGFGIKGFLWYQGENDRSSPSIYTKEMELLVKGWRELWNNQMLPFYFVQIAPFEYVGRTKDSVPYLREAQELAMKKIPNSGMIVTMDIGNKYTIHPPDKTTVAERLLLWALGDTYKWSTLAYRSPLYKSSQINSDSVIVFFDNSPLGLTSYDKEITGFEIAGKDRVFYKARASIISNERGKVLLESESVRKPIAIRYLFKDWAEGNLYNTAGLPVAPFRTDNW